MSPVASAGLPGFPLPAASSAAPAVLHERALALRHLEQQDLPWLIELYADTRREELDAVPWPAEAKRAFAQQQFELQHRHYLAHYPGAAYLAIEHGADDPIGRYYLQHGDDADLIVDISLLSQWRGHGIGRALIEASQREAAAAGRGMRLHVHHANPRARRLYERLGFSARQSSDTHLAMAWQC